VSRFVSLLTFINASLSQDICPGIQAVHHVFRIPFFTCQTDFYL
jgi:hypothetical protein